MTIDSLPTRKRLTCFSFFALFGALSAAAQAQFPARYSSAYGDSTANSVVVDGSGNCYVCGSTTNSAGSTDFLTVKYDAFGNVLWTRTYDGPAGAYDSANFIQVDSAGDVYVVGSSQNASSNDDIAILKYNAAGTIQWIRRYDGPGHFYDDPYAVKLDNAGNLVIVGTANTSTGHYDVVTMKYDASGTRIWTRFYDGPSHDFDEGKGVAIDSSDNVYVTGYSYKAGTSYDFVTLKYDSTGGLQWMKRYNGPGSGIDMPIGIVVDETGASYVTGKSVNGSSANVIATVKYDTNGTKLWVRQFGPIGLSEYPTGIVLDSADNVAISATEGSTGSAPDYRILKYDYSGVQQWTRNYSVPTTDSNDETVAIAVDSSNNLYMTGYLQIGEGPNWDYGTIKYSPSGARLAVRTYDGPDHGNDFANAIAVGADGHYFVVGYSQNLTTGFFDWAVVKY